MTKVCNREDCGVELVVGMNWSESNKKHYINVCKDCHNKYRRDHYKSAQYRERKPFAFKVIGNFLKDLTHFCILIDLYDDMDRYSFLDDFAEYYGTTTDDAIAGIFAWRHLVKTQDTSIEAIPSIMSIEVKA
jgi:hypothetical protein